MIGEGENKMHIREIAHLAPDYFEINREERNYAAIFFAALCRPGNTEKFLQHCGIDKRVDHPDFGIYFEYAYLRDLWKEISKDKTRGEGTKKQIIRMHLPIKGIDEILEMPSTEINRRFGIGGKVLQYPGRWEVAKYNGNFDDNDDFLKICRFKWSFNIKPDVVIHLDKDNVICIEAKYESREGSYPSSKLEKSIFHRRGLEKVGQVELQKYMMQELLGLRADYIILRKRNETKKELSWAEVFNCLDMSEMPVFARRMAKKISE
jgi:hypothetical protein